ncbi:hypothetical protein MTO96_035256 [Rhipicephalus appendiculatus]
MLRPLNRALVTRTVFLRLSLLGIVFFSTSLRAVCAAQERRLPEDAQVRKLDGDERYGTEHGLNFVLPKSRLNHYIGHPQFFSRRLVADISQYNMTYNILTHHTRYNDNEVRALMPADSLYVTVLQRPDSLFESLYSYYGICKRFRRNLTMFARDR